MKRALCLFMAFIMLFSLAACSGGKGILSRFSKDDEEPTEYLIIPYSRENGVNPFTANSLLNSTLMPLLYAGLYKIDASYNPTPDIAASIEYNGSRLVKVTINTDRLFSDGHPIKAEDVVNSFRAAKKSTYYSSALTTIDTCKIDEDDPNAVVFTTEIANTYVAALLTFPIVRTNTAKSNDSIPSGAGPYVYTATTDGGELTPNKYYEGTEYAMEKVTLTNVTDSANLNLGLVIGNVDAVFDDLSSGETQRIAARSAHVDLNNLIYLNISDRGVFSRPKMRQAISALIDRDDLVNGGYEGYGAATAVPFNSNWFALGEYEPTLMTKKEAKEYLQKQLGAYVINIFVSTDNNFKVKLAQTLKTQLNNAGINAEVRANAYEIYAQGIENHYADIWISEYKMTNDMNIGALISDEGLSGTYFSMASGNTTPEEFCNAFYEVVPFIPVCIRYGVTAYSKTMDGGVKPLPNNPFANLNDWSVGEES